MCFQEIKSLKMLGSIVDWNIGGSVVVLSFVALKQIILALLVTHVLVGSKSWIRIGHLFICALL